MKNLNNINSMVSLAKEINVLTQILLNNLDEFLEELEEEKIEIESERIETAQIETTNIEKR